MTSVARRVRSPFALSILFSLSLGVWWGSSQFAAPAPHGHPPSFEPVQQPQDERGRPLREFDLRKRGGDDADYQAALERACRMPRAAISDGANGAWASLGPGAAGEAGDACRNAKSVSTRALLAAGAGKVNFHGGAVSADGKTIFGASEQGLLRGSVAGIWKQVFDGGAGFVAVNPHESEIVYAARPGLSLGRSSDGGQTFVAAMTGVDDDGLYFAPFAMDMNAPRQLWTGGRALWRTVDGGERWARASANIAGSEHARFSAIAISPGNPNVVIGGDSEGFIYRSDAAQTTDAATVWSSTQPRAGFVSSLVFDPQMAGVVYAAYSTFGGAHVWRSADGGATWTAIDGEGETALPDAPAHTLVVDPNDSQRLIVGTDIGVFVTGDGGRNWSWERAGFGVAPVEALVVKPADGEVGLFAFTRGRGVWRLSLGPDQSCGFAITPAAQGFDGLGGTDNVYVTAAANCAWTATSSAAWITINTGATGMGAGVVSYTVAANTASDLCRATLTIAGRIFTVEQAGRDGICSPRPITSGQTLQGRLSFVDCRSRLRGDRFFARRFTFDARAGELAAVSLRTDFFSGYLYLFAPNGQLLAENGDGSGGAQSLARIPAGTGFFPLPVTGSYTIEITTRFELSNGSYALNLNIVPSNCGAAGLAPTRQSFDPQGGEGRVNVAMGNGCLWSAVSNATWIRITSGATGGGSMFLTYAVAANTGAYRTGSLTIAGETFTIEQAGQGGNCLPRQLTPEQIITASLSFNDCRSRVKSSDTLSYNADLYSFNATAGQQAVFVASSTAFRAGLTLFDPQGVRVADGSGRLPAGEQFFNLTQTGVYTLEITEDRQFPGVSSTGAYTLGVNLGTAGCQYKLGAAKQQFDGVGGNGGVNVTAGGGCAWQVTNLAPWVTLNAGEKGVGDGAVNFTVAENTGNFPRSTTLVIAGRSFVIEQAGKDGKCAVTPITPGQTVSGTLRNTDCLAQFRNLQTAGASGPFYAQRYSFRATAGQQARINIATPAYVPYAYLIGPNGAVVAEGAGEQAPGGDGVITLPSSGAYLIETTSRDANRTGAYQLALHLAPAGCNFKAAATAQQFDAAGGAAAVNVAAGGECAWTATSVVDWLTLSTGGGKGNGSLSFTVAANSNAAPRIGALFVAGQTLTIEQSGRDGTCAPQPLAAGRLVNGVLNSGDCQALVGTATETVDRYTFAGAAGERIFLQADYVNATSSFSTPTLTLLAPGGATLARANRRIPASGVFFTLPVAGMYTLRVSGSGSYTLILTRATGTCNYAVAAGQRQFEAGAATGGLDVTTGSGCDWQSVSLANWITITTGASGAGNGNVTFALAANTDARRRVGGALVAGRVIEIEQAGAGGNCAVLPITPGQTVSGAITNADCGLPAPRFTSGFVLTGAGPATDRYSFRATAGELIALNLLVLRRTSFSVEATLRLLDPGGVVIAQGLPRIPASNDFFSLPASGVYIIEVGRGSSTEEFDYLLNLSGVAAECAYEITPRVQRVEANGGSVSVTVKAAQGCAWTAASFSNWLTLNTGAAGAGNGVVTFTATANPDSSSRRGVILVAGQSIFVDQAGRGGSCAPVAITPGQDVNGQIEQSDCLARFHPNDVFGPYRADILSFNYTEGQQLSTQFEGFGPTTLYFYDAEGNQQLPFRPLNLNTPALFSFQKSGVYFIEIPYSPSSPARYRVRLNLASGCAFTFAPVGGVFDPQGGEGRFDLITGDNCSWTAADFASWARITSAKTGRGRGSITYTVGPNTDAFFPRDTSFSITGVGAPSAQFRITQAGRLGNCAPISLTPGQIVRGSVNTNDCRVRSDRNDSSASGDTYLFEGTTGQQVRVTLSSSGFRPFMSLFAPTGEVLADNQGLQIPRAGSVFTLPMNGTYQLTVGTTGFSSEAGDYSLLLETFPAGCGYLLTPDRQQYEFAGGAGRVSVVASGNCVWTARSAVEWITVQSGAAGSGNGAVTFTVAPNNTFSARSGAVVIAGRSIVIEQAGLNGACAVTPIALGQTIKGRITAGDCLSRGQPFNLSPPFYADRYSFTGGAGQTIVLTVTAVTQPLITLFDAAGAPMAQNSSSGRFLSDGSFTLPADGAYIIEVSAVADFDYALNLALQPSGCGFTLDTNSQRFNFAGGRGRIGVTTGAGCAWTAVTDASWITLNVSSGSGAGAVAFTVAPNDSGGYRSGAILVAGQMVAVEQAGLSGACLAMSLTPGQTASGSLSADDCPSSRSNQFTTYYADRYSFAAAAGRQVLITALAERFAPALTLFDPNGLVVAQFESARVPPSGDFLTLPLSGNYVLEISSRQARAAGEYKLTLSLAPMGCGYLLSQTAQSFEFNGGQGSVNVLTSGGCTWDAVSNASWITLNAGASGEGNGAVSFTVALNPTTTARSGALIIAGQTVIIEQAGVGGACALKPIAPGQPVSGSLSAADCAPRLPLANADAAEAYSFNATAGQQVLLTMTLPAVSPPSDFRPLLSVFAPNGSLIAQSDTMRLPAGNGLLTLSNEGVYVFEVAGARAARNSNYTLNLTTAPANCGYTITPTRQSFNDRGGQGAINVTAGAGCAWTAAPDSPAITINSGASGAGNGTVRFTIGSLGSGYRTAKITIGGQDFFVEQGTRTCVPQPITPGREEREFLRTSDCPSLLRTDAFYHVNRWSFAGTAGQRVAVASRSRDFSPYLTLLDPSGAALAQDGVDNQRTLRLPAGDGYFFLPATGTYTIEVTSVTAAAVNSGSINEYFLTVLLQPACGEFAVTPKMLDFPAIGGSTKLNITATAGCDWAVNSGADWLTAVKPVGFGTGETEIVVAANPAATPRAATLLVAGQTVTVTQAGAIANVSAASFSLDGVAAESLASAFGAGLADTTAIANPPATTVAGTTVKVRDSQGATRDALIFAVTPAQINYLVPTGVAPGPAAVIITSASGKVSTGVAQIVTVAPGLFTANADGRGLATGVALRVKPDGTRTFEPLLRYDAAQQRFVAVPIDLGAADEQVYFIGFGTGFRFRSALSAVTARVGGVAAQINYAGAQGELFGLDQLNVLLPRSLAGRGEVEVLLTVDGRAANPARISVR